MQISRLFEIVYLLLNKDNITASDLAQRFEVSTRTIYRDIDALCQAGIPIYTAKGKNGGIRLLNNFVLNKSLLSPQEQTEILTALEGFQASSYPGAGDALSKLSLLFRRPVTNWIDVDFSSWGQYDQEQFQRLKAAVVQRQCLSLDYYSSTGEKTARIIEPLQLCFKGRAWYLSAYCRKAKDYRLFKLSRIKNLQVLQESFLRELPPAPFAAPADAPSKSPVTVVLRIEKTLAYRVYDEFEPQSIQKNEDGSFTVTASYLEDEWVYGYLLSFGPLAQVQSPPYLRDLIRNRLLAAAKNYS